MALPRSRTTPAAVVAGLLLAACADRVPVAPDVSPADPSPSAAPSAQRLTPTAQATRYLVGVEPGVRIPAQALALAGGRLVDSIPAGDVFVIEGASNPAALQVDGVRFVEAAFETTIDVYREPSVGEEASLDATVAPPAGTAPWSASGVQWEMRSVKADEVWALTQGGAGARVCIVDTGVDADHQEVAGRVALRANFVQEPAAQAGPGVVADGNGHGSHVAGTVGAGGTVMQGVAPRATILGARAFRNNGSALNDWIIRAMDWCGDNGAHVVNLSLGGISYRGLPDFVAVPRAFTEAVARQTGRGVVVVVSAGNSNLRLPNRSGALRVVPSEVEGAITVGATGPVTRVGTFPVNGVATALPFVPPAWNPFDPQQVWQSPDAKAFYSNFGPVVEIFAPGGRGGVPLTYPYFRVNNVTQGHPRDNMYSLCSGGTSQSGVTNANGAPSATAGSCLGQTNRYIAYAGTSMAAPIVSGAAAVLYAELGAVRSAANRERVTRCLLTTTDDIGPAETFGGGRLNLKRALDALRAGAC